MRKIGVDIIQPMVPAYRTALFEGLARDPELLVSVQCAPEWPVGQRSVAMAVSEYFPDRSTSRIMGSSLLWQSGLKLIHAKGPGDVLVVSGNIHYLSNIPLMLSARRKGIGVVWWGHHRSATSISLGVAVRLAMAKRMADCFLMYTDTGIEALAAKGFDRSTLFATGNTVDLTAIDDAAKRWDVERLKEFQEKEQLAGKKVLLFSSVLNPKTRLDVAIRAIAALNDPTIELVVIGDGTMRGEYERLAQKCGIADRVRWLGEMRDQNLLAPWFLSTKAFVYPGAIGLSLMHAFGYGLPVITHGNADAQMPEFEALKSGENGLVFEENNEKSLAETIKNMLSNEERRTVMGKVAGETVHEKYTMKRMIARFKECIVMCSKKNESRQG